jgi:hypothetical protein
MDHGTDLREQGLRPEMRLEAILFLIAGVGLLALIFNNPLFSYFDVSRTADEALAYVRDNLTGLRWMFTGVGVMDLLLGSSLWLWGTHVRQTVSGRQATAATFASWAGLWGGVVLLATRLTTAWFQSVEDLAYTGEVRLGAVEIMFLTGLLAWTIAFVIFGVLVIRGPMPKWLGIVLIACGVLPYVGFLPFWYYFGAIVLGITVLVRLRGARST